MNSALFLPKQIVRFNCQIVDRLFNVARRRHQRCHRIHHTSHLINHLLLPANSGLKRSDGFAIGEKHSEPAAQADSNNQSPSRRWGCCAELVISMMRPQAPGSCKASRHT